MFSARLKAEEEPGNAEGVNVEVQKGRKMFTREIVSLMVNIYIEISEEYWTWKICCWKTLR